MLFFDDFSFPEPTLSILIWILAYAETHYRFKFIPSRYFKKEPEIIFDLPRRLQPGRELPVLLLVKDAHLFPIQLREVLIRIKKEGDSCREKRFIFNERMNRRWFYRLFYLSRHNDDAGWREITVECTALIRGKLKKFVADNYALTGHRPFRCYFAHERLSLGRNYYSGDLHAHSWFTSDQIEFGAPPKAMVEMAKAMGHDFLAITDHSYDLDDEPENFLKNDPDLKKWRTFREEAFEINAVEKNFVVLPGEEVSSGNCRGENVHFLVFNNPEFIPGAGDSGEKWLRTKPDLSIGGIMRRTSARSLHFAAHPQAPIPFPQRLLLNRNLWRWRDYQHENLHGLQIWNGHSRGREEGLASWIKLLLQGRKIFIIAGSDAHGNFNRYRQIRMPHLILEEHEKYHLFGQHRTIAHMPEGLSLENLISALKKGACSITSGPFLAISGETSGGVKVFMGGTIRTEAARLKIEAKSSSEFAPLRQIVLYRGDLNARAEAVPQKIPLDKTRDFSEAFHVTTRREEPVYYRAELLSGEDGKLVTTALTNPIWHMPS